MSLRVVSGRTIIEMDLGLSEMAQTILCALEPETESVPSERATTTIRADESKLVLEILAEDLTALRAAMNSFLAWISGAKRALEYVNSH